MKNLWLFTLLVCSLAQAEEIRFTAQDGIDLYADWYEGSVSPAPLVILFHQARGSARGEYPAIIEHLQLQGYAVMAVDQRSGGDRFGAPNRTVDALGGRDYGYCEAYPDLVAALTTGVERSGGPVAVWGSSYSAGLVFRLAAEYPDKVAAVLAFSPASGGPMVDCSPMDVIDNIKVPLLAFRPEKEMQIESVQMQAKLFAEQGIRLEVIEGGVHGSSMLVPERTDADIKATWAIVDKFLSRYLNVTTSE